MIRVLITDDDPFIRESLRLILELDPELTVIGVCSHGEEALQALRQAAQAAGPLDAGTANAAPPGTSPAGDNEPGPTAAWRKPADVVLMDIRMPVCDGVAGARLIKAAFPAVQVLMLTTFDDDDYIVQALHAGASGYLLKNIAPDRIVQGIKTVHQGNLLIHPDIARKLTAMLAPAPPAAPPAVKPLSAFGLTAAEQAIVAKIADGLSNKEIAQELFLSEGTVKNYVTDILGKLQLRDRTQIAIFYLKNRG